MLSLVYIGIEEGVGVDSRLEGPIKKSKKIKDSIDLLSALGAIKMTFKSFDKVIEV